MLDDGIHRANRLRFSPHYCLVDVAIEIINREAIAGERQSRQKNDTDDELTGSQQGGIVPRSTSSRFPSIESDDETTYPQRPFTEALIKPPGSSARLCVLCGSRLLSRP